MRAAAQANIDANTQKAVSDAMMKIDQANIASTSNADVRNAMTQRMEENARVLDDLSYEKRQMIGLSKQQLENQEYFDKIQDVNIGNYQTINALNNLNQRYSDVKFDGQNYVSSAAPDFMNTLEMQNAMKYYQMMLNEQETKK